jgi:hypothetical protein
VKRITTAREQLELLSPWLITAAPPAFDKVYDDGGEFLRRERPQDFPSLPPAPEVEELAEPPKKVRLPNFQTYELSDGTVVKQPNNPAQQDLFPKNESLTSGIPWVSEAPDPERFKKVKPSPQELPEGWEAAEVGSGKKKTEITVSPEGNRYRTMDGVQVGEDGNLLPTPEGMEAPPSGNQSVLSPEDESKGGAPIDPENEWDSRNPDGQGFHEAMSRFLVPDELERSLIAKYNASDKGTREAGGQWYDTANEYIHNLAQKAGIDPSKVGAIVSAFSPQTSWDQNMAAANYFIMNFDPDNPDAINDKMGGLGDNLKRAKRIYGADSEEGYLEGLQNGNDAHKITNFYHNLMGSKDHVTIDSWMARALLGQGAEGLADKSVQKVLNWKDGYDTMANSVRSAAEKLGISPRELQAIVWSQVVPTAGSYEELSPEQYRKQKKQRDNYVKNAPENAKLLPDYFHGPGWESRPEPTYDNQKPFSPGYLNGLPANDNTAFYKREGRFWQKQADAPRVLYRGIHLNPHVKPGQTGYIPPELYAVIRQHGLTSKQFADAFAQSTWGTRFSPMRSVAESFAKQAPPGIPSAVIAVDWDGNGRASDPHAEMSQFPDSWFGGTRPTADPDPFQEVRLKPGKQLKVRSLQVRSPEQGQWKELLNGGPTVIRTATVHESGIQDNKYPPHWIDKAEELAKNTGGFTIHDDPTTPGDAPSSGYQVAIPGHETTSINTGQGWANWAKENNELLTGGPNRGLGTWFNDEDNLYYTEPSETIHNYDDASRATLDRDQWAMWDNGAFRVNPQTGEKEFFDQATVPRTDIAQQGIANSLGFTMAKNLGITYTPTALKQGKRFWEG